MKNNFENPLERTEQLTILDLHPTRWCVPKFIISMHVRIRISCQNLKMFYFQTAWFQYLLGFVEQNWNCHVLSWVGGLGECVNGWVGGWGGECRARLFFPSATSSGRRRRRWEPGGPAHAWGLACKCDGDHNRDDALVGALARWMLYVESFRHIPKYYPFLGPRKNAQRIAKDPQT